ncbi:MAG: alcohol dehydrogenase catalytic domain-containing protein, partial [Candidatus Lokiarchaeota archaeon]|nr:alcohol dehydrogenase catalytic domain-containing protein [Candidatus Lokiarchaeota archaeon]
EPNKVSIEEVEIPEPKSNEILLEIAYCGICGSDLHAFRGKHPFIPLPATPGHEFSAIIEKVGKNISHFQKGDKVTVEPSLTCGECYNCRIGRYNICENLRVMGCQGDGAMADYLIVPSEKVIPIPDELSLLEATLSEPIAVGVHAVKRAGVLLNKNVVIIGSGMIGLSVIINVVKAGAKEITVTDLSDSRLKKAEELGATQTINATKTDAIEEIKQNQPYEGIDVVFECVGVEQSIRDAIEIVRKGGKIIVVGVFGEETKIQMAYVQDRELELIGSLMYTRRDFTEAVQMLANKEVPPELFISKIMPLEKAQHAFEQAFNKEENLKIILEVNKEK